MLLGGRCSECSLQFRINLAKAEKPRVERERDVALMAACFQVAKKYNGSQVEIIKLKYSSLNSNICNIANIAEKLSEIFASLAANIFSRTIFLLAGKIHYLLSLLNLNIILQDPGTNFVREKRVNRGENSLSKI